MKLENGALWLFTITGLVIQLFTVFFFTVYWQKNIIGQVNEIIQENTQEFNKALDEQDAYIQKELNRVYEVVNSTEEAKPKKPLPTPKESLEFESKIPSNLFIG